MTWHRHPMNMRLKMGVGKDGRLIFFDCGNIADNGASIVTGRRLHSLRVRRLSLSTGFKGFATIASWCTRTQQSAAHSGGSEIYRCGSPWRV